MNDSTVVARVEQVSKRFRLRHEKSLKDRLVHRGARRRSEDFWPLQDISLDVHLGSTIGLVGHNGSGKSTLLKIIGGIISPTSGSVSLRGRLAALLELGTGFHPDLTGRENVYLNAALLGLSRRQTAALFDEIVEFSGIGEFIDTPVKHYSSGMYVRLAFSVAVHVDPDLLLVDEVLAVGDEAFQRKCMEKIAQFQRDGRAIVVVSHSAPQIGQLCDRVVFLDGGRIVHDGDTTEGLNLLRRSYVESAFGSTDERRAPYRLAAVAVTTNDTTPTTTDVQLDIDVEINEPSKQWGVSISIDNGFGAAMFVFNTFDFGRTLPNTPGTHRLEFRLPAVSFAPGIYQVHAWVGDGAQTFDRRFSAATIEIPRMSFGDGLVRLAPELVIREPE